MDNIQKYVYLICFTGYLREQSALAKDAGAEEFKLTGGKGTQNWIAPLLSLISYIIFCALTILGKITLVEKFFCTQPHSINL